MGQGGSKSKHKSQSKNKTKKGGQSEVSSKRTSATSPKSSFPESPRSDSGDNSSDYDDVSLAPVTAKTKPKPSKAAKIPYNSSAYVDHIIQRLEENDATLTELTFDRHPAFAEMDKSSRGVRQQRIADSLRTNHHVTIVKLNGVHLDDAFAVALAQALVINKTVLVVELEQNDITSVGTQALAQMLTENSTITELSLRKQLSPLGAEGQEALLAAVEDNKTLTRLAAEILDPATHDAIAKQLLRNIRYKHSESVHSSPQSSPMEDSMLRNVEPPPFMMIMPTALQMKMMAVLTNNFSDTVLDLSDDKEFTLMSPEEKMALADGMSANTVIQTLKLMNVELSDSFLGNFSLALAHNTSLKEIHLQKNMFNGASILLLLKAVQQHPSIKILHLQSQYGVISTAEEQQIVDILTKSKLQTCSIDLQDPQLSQRYQTWLKRT